MQKLSYTCSKSKLNTAFCKYRTPPCINLVLLLLVPLEKSYFSTIAVFKPERFSKIKICSFEIQISRRFDQWELYSFRN